MDHPVDLAGLIIVQADQEAVILLREGVALPFREVHLREAVVPLIKGVRGAGLAVPATGALLAQAEAAVAIHAAVVRPDPVQDQEVLQAGAEEGTSTSLNAFG